ncbi:MAG: carbohydrate ABC transporter permease [bacterium]|nr:carbohydrate ABC transporter permease [Candidatus Sumerlaeota bacterium]
MTPSATSVAAVAARPSGLARSVALHALVYAGAATMLLPFIWMVSTSLKASGSVFDVPPKWIPNPVAWGNYRETLESLPFGWMFVNTVIVSGCITLGQLLTSSLAGYAFARVDFRGRDRLFLAYLATMMVPGAVTMIPVFITVRMLDLVDTYWALILPGVFTAYGTFMMRQFFMAIPRELEEAAFIDGSGHFGVYRRIVLPLSKPALATLGTFTFMGAWRDFMWPLLVTNSETMQTLAVGLASFQGMYYTAWPLLMAGSVLVMAPLVGVFLFNQRFFIESIKLEGIKG